MALVIAFSICLKSTAKENKKVTCDEVLNACNTYAVHLEEQQQVFKTIIKKQNERIIELYEKSNSPAWYWYFIGGIVGGVAISKTLK